MKRAIQVSRYLGLLWVFMLLANSLAIPQSTQHGQSAKDSAKSVSSDQLSGSLAEGNKRFVEGKPKSQDIVSRRSSLQKDQHPLVAVLSCSDSRVPPEIVFDQGLGDLFVVRAAGNSADPMGIGSPEYVVEHLGTVMVVVLGHQSCGAVTAACSGEKMPTLNLDAVAKPIVQSCSVAKQRAKENPVDFAMRDHVHRTAQELLAHSAVLRHAHEERKLTIVEAYIRWILAS
jgi:carbonic anhydrase